MHAQCMSIKMCLLSRPQDMPIWILRSQIKYCNHGLPKTELPFYRETFLSIRTTAKKFLSHHGTVGRLRCPAVR